MAGGGKGGSQTSQVQIPQWLEDAAQAGIDRGEAIANIGYQPYYGPDVAAMNAQQMAAFGNINDMAGAFNMGGGTPMSGMPAAQDFGGGLLGYSSQPGYAQAVSDYSAANPGQAAYVADLFVNPQTGADPNWTAPVTTSEPAAPSPAWQDPMTGQWYTPIRPLADSPYDFGGGNEGMAGPAGGGFGGFGGSFGGLGGLGGIGDAVGSAAMGGWGGPGDLTG